jgi:hypothetical protein
MGRLLLSALLLAAFAVACGQQSGQDTAREKERHHLGQGLGQQRGQHLNASSPLTLALVQDKLRRGMLIEEFARVVAERNQTVVPSHPGPAA